MCNGITNCVDGSDEGIGCVQRNCSAPSAPTCDHSCVSTPNGPVSKELLVLNFGPNNLTFYSGLSSSSNYCLFPFSYTRGVTVVQVSGCNPALSLAWTLMNALQNQMLHVNTFARILGDPTAVSATLASTLSQITKAARRKVLLNEINSLV